MLQLERLFIELNRALVAMLLLAVFVIVCINVVGRYGFGASLSWAEEATRHLMILGAFAGAGLALREGRLVAITTLPDRLNPIHARMLRILTLIIMALLWLVVLWLGIEFVEFGWNKQTMSTDMSRGIPYLSLPIGAVLFLTHLTLCARDWIAGTLHDAPLEE